MWIQWQQLIEKRAADHLVHSIMASDVFREEFSLHRSNQKFLRHEFRRFAQNRPAPYPIFPEAIATSRYRPEHFPTRLLENSAGSRRCSSCRTVRNCSKLFRSVVRSLASILLHQRDRPSLCCHHLAKSSRSLFDRARSLRTPKNLPQVHHRDRAVRIVVARVLPPIPISSGSSMVRSSRKYSSEPSFFRRMILPGPMLCGSFIYDDFRYCCSRWKSVTCTFRRGTISSAITVGSRTRIP